MRWPIGCGLALAVLVRLPELVKLPVVDQANFMLAARELAHGRVLYRDLFDVKPPLIYWVYAALGGGGAPPYPVVVLADLALTAALLCVVARILRVRLAEDERGPALWMLGISAAFPYFSTDLGVLQPETLTNLLVALALLASAGGRPSGWWIGALALAAGLAKILPAAVVLGVALVACEPGWRGRVLARAGAVCAAGGVAFALALWRAGALEGFLEAMRYASFQRGIRVMVQLHIEKLVPFWLLPALLAVAGVALAWKEAPQAPLRWWLGLGLAQLALQGKFYAYHFLAIVPPLAIIAGVGLARLARLAGPFAGFRLVVVCLLVHVAAALSKQLDFNSLAIARLTGNLTAEKYEDATETTWGISALAIRRAAEMIRTRTSPADGIFVFGVVPQVALLADRPMWGPYIFHYQLLVDTPFTRGFGDLAARQRAFLAAFDAAPPRVVIVPDDQSPVPGAMETSRELGTFAGLAERVQRDYECVRVDTMRIGFRR